MKFATKLGLKAGAIIFVLLMLELPAAFAGEIHDVAILERETLLDNDYDLRLTVTLGNRQQQLLLNESSAFSNLKVHRTEKSGLHQPTQNDSILSYQGIVENVPNSWVRVTTDGDHINGVINILGERNFITSDSKSYLNTNIRQIRGLRRAVDKSINPPPETLPDRNRRTNEVIQINVDSGFGNPQDLVTRVAKVAIVVDALYDEALGGRGLAVAISTINTVDGMFQQEFGLALQVDTAIIITDTTTLDLGNVSLEQNLLKFRDYRQFAPELDQNLSLVHLFTGVTTADPSVGLAYIGAVCRTDGYDVSMSTPFNFPVLLTAHEISHNLGAIHDDETDLCGLTTDQLMFSHISSLSSNEFSSCAVDAINKRLNQSACHLDAIDLALTLSKNGDEGVIALITNTDTQRAIPSAKFSLQIKNASIASAPASCEIKSTTELECAIPTTYPGESQSLEVELRFHETLENTLDATLEAIGFIDIKSINNQAQIIIPAQATTDPPISIANNDDDGTTTPTGSANPADNGIVDDNNNIIVSGGSSGGGSLQLTDLLLLLITLVSLSSTSITRRKQPMLALAPRAAKNVSV